MANILTSWKEIGQYLGKGVRTVQRWEREAGLPVRRRESAKRHAVLAMPEELDQWARSRTRGPTGLIADALRREMAVLREEMLELRRRVEQMENGGDEEANSRMRFTPERTLKVRVSLKEIGKRVLGARQARARTIRSSLTFASTLCAIGESGFGSSSLDVTQHARRSIQSIRGRLASPGYVPEDEIDELRAQLRELESRIELIGAEASGKREERTS